MKKINLILVVFLLFLIQGCIFYKNCESDLVCFKEYAKDCSKVKMYTGYEGTIVKTTIRGIEDNHCVVSLKIEEIGESVKQQYPKESLMAERMTLNCELPLSIEYYQEIENIKNSFDQYCSGPIKDILKGPLKEELARRGII